MQRCTIEKSIIVE